MGLVRGRTFAKQLDQFAKEIVENTAGTEIESWESVAGNFNSYLYENKLWNTKYFFFDGPSCHEAFRRNLLWISSKSNGTKSEVFRKHPYIEEALNVYFSEVDKQWNRIYSEAPLNSIGVENIQLPGYSYRSKLFLLFKRLAKKHGLALSIFCCSSVLLSLQYRIFLFSLCSFFLMHIFNEYQFFDFKRFSSLEAKHKLQYLSSIIGELGKSNANGWDIIAKKMNLYMCEQKIWGLDVFFFDGDDCAHFFDHYFLSDLPPRKSFWPLLPNAELLPYIEKAQSVLDNT